MTSLAIREMRILSDAEIAMVAGGPDTRGVNEVVNYGDMSALTSDGTFQQTTGYVIADYDHDGIFDQAWYADGSGHWWTSFDGQNWNSSNPLGPVNDIINWENGHRPHNLDG